jgi:hypothetical protein
VALLDGHNVRKAARPDHLVEALGIVEQLRSISVGIRGGPKHGI